MNCPAHTVAITVDSTRTVIRLDRCDARLMKGIRTRAAIAIQYGTAEGTNPVAFTTSLDGLKAALASIG